MPQPLLSLQKGDWEINWDPNAAFDQYPELALLVAKCQATWASTERGIANFLADSLGADAKVAMSILQALSSTSAQLAALEAVAADVLPTGHEDRPFFEGAMKIYKSQSKIRNRLIHHIWGVEKNTPGRLILTDPAALTDLMWRTKHFRALAPKDPAELEQWFETTKLRSDSTFCYAKRDLEDILRDFKETDMIWGMMAQLVQTYTEDWILPKQRVRDRISALPLMKNALQTRK